jgi:hypothetical protein
MTSEHPDDPTRPRKDDDEAVDEDDEAAEREREGADRAFEHELENADEFEPTLDVPLPIGAPRSKKARR